MKKFLGTRIGVILITALVCVVAFGGIAYAASFSKDVSATGRVVTANPDLVAYSDEACTIPLTSITFGDLIQGESTQSIVYLKNEGNKDLFNLTAIDNLDAGIGTIDVLVNSMSVAKGVIIPATITTSISQSGTVGDFNATITFNCTY